MESRRIKSIHSGYFLWLEIDDLAIERQVRRIQCGCTTRKSNTSI